jgi:hypothetical protein
VRLCSAVLHISGIIRKKSAELPPAMRASYALAPAPAAASAAAPAPAAPAPAPALAPAAAAAGGGGGAGAGAVPVSSAFPAVLAAAGRGGAGAALPAGAVSAAASAVVAAAAAGRLAGADFKGYNPEQAAALHASPRRGASHVHVFIDAVLIIFFWGGGTFCLSCALSVLSCVLRVIIVCGRMRRATYSTARSTRAGLERTAKSSKTHFCVSNRMCWSVCSSAADVSAAN